MSEVVHLRDLNPAQLTAVRHGEGPLLIFAGAGSGKTRVLTRRIASLVLDHRVHPSAIFAVTFTNKAAEEMKSRVLGLLTDRSGPLWVSTFHSSCARILRSYAELLDYSNRFAIYDTSDSRSALKRVYQRLKLDSRELDPGLVLSMMDRAKNEYKFPDDIRRSSTFPPHITGQAADVFEAYQEELRGSNAMDFGDLLCNVITLFRLEPKILERYQEQFDHLLIDEYQDTNRVQYMLVKMLAQAKRNICVVGDDDQSIYAFRGATVDNILNFRRDFPDATVVTLDQNYRSTKTIVQAASAIIARNSRRQKKTLRTDNAPGAPIVAFRGYDEQQEAEFVVRRVTQLVRQGLPYSEVAVFYRTNAQSRAVEEAFVENNIPYEIYGSNRFYDRKEIKDILAYYRLLLNPRDNESFLRVVNTPSRGIGPKALAALGAFGQERGLPLLLALQTAMSERAQFLSGAVQRNFLEFLKIIEQLQAAAAEAETVLASTQGATATTTTTPIATNEQVTAISEVLRAIAEQTGYLARLKSEESVEADGRIENIYELCNVAAEFSRRALEEGRPLALLDFLDRTSLSSDLDKEGTDISTESVRATGAVSLMTLHLAKGLEFDSVFLLGLEEGLLPHVRSLDDASALEEERRLCYVGITRARARLFLTRVTDRWRWNRGSWYSGYPSRFISDLPESIVDDVENSFFPESAPAYRSAR